MYFQNDPALFKTFAFILGVQTGLIVFSLFLIWSKIKGRA